MRAAGTYTYLENIENRNAFLVHNLPLLVAAKVLTVGANI
jgi:hypothetical protein